MRSSWLYLATRSLRAGAPGAIIREDGKVAGTMILEVAGDRIAAVRSVVNPDKLRHLD